MDAGFTGIRVRMRSGLDGPHSPLALVTLVWGMEVSSDVEAREYVACAS